MALPVGAKPDDVCAVCLLGQPTADNGMIYCDGKCAICVHQECYGVLELPSEQKWFCRRCEPYSTVRSSKIKCIACPEKNGALKATTGHEEFCHVVCALWLPNASFGNPKKLEPIELGPSSDGPHTFCSICQAEKKPRDVANYGMTIPCAHEDCDARMHVTCAQSYGLLVVPTHRGKMTRGTKSRFIAYCRMHRVNEAPKATKAQGGGLTEFTSEDGSTIRLHDHVKAYWKGGRMLYSGTITAVNGDGTFAVTYHDGDYEASVPKSRLRPMLPMRSAKHAAAKTMAEQALQTKKQQGGSAKAEPRTGAKRKSVGIGETSPPMQQSKRLQGLPATPMHSRARSDSRNARSPPDPNASRVGSPDIQPDLYRAVPLVDKNGIDPNDTPAADELEKSVKEFWKGGKYPFCKFLFRGHPGVDPDLFQRLEDARGAEKDLMSSLADLKSENERLKAAKQTLFGPLAAADHIPKIDLGSDRARVVRDALCSALGVTDSLSKLDAKTIQSLDEQMRIISDSITGLVGGKVNNTSRRNMRTV